MTLLHALVGAGLYLVGYLVTLPFRRLLPEGWEGGVGLAVGAAFVVFGYRPAVRAFGLAPPRTKPRSREPGER